MIIAANHNAEPTKLAVMDVTKSSFQRIES